MYLDKFKLRDHNERIVLEALIANQPISRVDLSKITKLNKASITNIVNVLIEKHLINEVGFGVSQNLGGRRPILLELNQHAGFTLSIDLGNNYISAILTDLNGKEAASFLKKDRDFTADNNLIYASIDDIVREFMPSTTASVYGIVSMVLAIHGVVQKNHIKVAPNYNLVGLNLHKTLSEKYPFPVYLENEANLAILGQISQDKAIDNAVLLSIHTGIGAGIVINRSLYYGSQGAAGEVGHFTLYPNGKTCRCGRKGCFEQYCSTKVITDKFKTLFPNRNVNPIEIQKADLENTEFHDFLLEVASNLAVGIQSIVAHFDPEIVYIVSDILPSLPHIKNAIETQLKTMYKRNIPIVISDIDLNVILLGGANLGISKFLGTEQFLLKQ